MHSPWEQQCKNTSLGQSQTSLWMWGFPLVESDSRTYMCKTRNDIDNIWELALRRKKRNLELDCFEFGKGMYGLLESSPTLSAISITWNQLWPRYQMENNRNNHIGFELNAFLSYLMYYGSCFSCLCDKIIHQIIYGRVCLGWAIKGTGHIVSKTGRQRETCTNAHFHLFLCSLESQATEWGLPQIH